MKYYIFKIDEDNNYKIESEVEYMYKNQNGDKSKFIGYLSNVQWDDNDIKEKLSKLKVGDHIIEIR